MLWAEAPHQSLARLQFSAFSHPGELPLLPICFHFCNIELTLLAPVGEEFSHNQPALQNTEHAHGNRNTRRARAHTVGLVRTKNVKSSTLWIIDGINSEFSRNDTLNR